MYKNPEDEKAYQRRHYEANKELYKERAKVSREAQKIKNKEYVKQYLLTHPCVDCGITDVRVLQFDHREPDGNHKPISRLIKSRGLLEKEIAKCDVRCANCHMIRTAEQFGWSRMWDE